MPALEQTEDNFLRRLRDSLQAAARNFELKGVCLFHLEVDKVEPTIGETSNGEGTPYP